jgi:predicted dehydrogenase
MKRLTIGVAGAGLIAQVEHVPNLLALKDRFEIVAVADPSAATRAHMERRFGVRTVAGYDGLLALKPDAMLIAAPDAYHIEYATRALAAGLHVFCEKPLGYSAAEIDGLIAARDAAGRVLQVGYMKRFDPAYEMLLEATKGLGARLRYVTVEVNDPDSWPFVGHHGYFRADDVPAELRAEGGRRMVEQIARAIGRTPDRTTLRGYAGPFASSMVHDLNVAMGLFESLGIGEVRPVSASIFAGGEGGAATLSLAGGQALCHLSHVAVPGLADYHERISIFFDDRRFELTFPSPYLNHFPTRLRAYTSAGERLTASDLREGYGEPFVRELVGFWEAAAEGKPVRNAAEHARADMALIEAFGRLAAGG